MAWDAIAALGSVLAVIVIAASAAVAVFQLRELRKATQLQSFLSLMGEATSPQMAQWSAYVEHVLPERMNDPVYRRELEEGHYDFEHHKEILLGAYWEKVGTIIHLKLIDPDAILDFAGVTCPYHWRLLKDIAALRRRKNPQTWVRFEELAEMCDQYIGEQDEGTAVAKS
jgi:hypothetical protein